MKKNINDRDSFLAYINNPMSRESVAIMIAANNITNEKCELFGDFIYSLLDLIFDTYLGDEVTNYDNQFKHFEWCWKTTVDNFKKEKIKIGDPRLYDYFLEFTFEVFYLYEEKPLFDYKDKNIINLWGDIFDLSKIKTNSEVDTLIEIYKIFNESLKNK